MFMESWWKAFENGRRLEIIQLHSGEKLVGAMALYEARPWQHCGLPVHRFVGAAGPTCPEYLGLLARRSNERDVIHATASYFEKRESSWHAIDFADVANDDSVTQDLVRRLASSHDVYRQPGPDCAFANLPDDYEQLVASPKLKHKHQKSCLKPSNGEAIQINRPQPYRMAGVVLLMR